MFQSNKKSYIKDLSDVNPITKSLPDPWILGKYFGTNTFEQRLFWYTVLFIEQAKIGYTRTLKGRRAGRGPANLCEGMKIGLSISNSKIDDKIDKYSQAGIINAISSTSSGQINFDLEMGKDIYC